MDDPNSIKSTLREVDADLLEADISPVHVALAIYVELREIRRQQAEIVRLLTEAEAVRRLRAASE